MKFSLSKVKHSFSKNELNEITYKNRSKLLAQMYKIIDRKLKKGARRGFTSISVNLKRNNCEVSSVLIDEVCEHYRNLEFEVDYSRDFYKLIICWGEHRRNSNEAI